MKKCNGYTDPSYDLPAISDYVLSPLIASWKIVVYQSGTDNPKLLLRGTDMWINENDTMQKQLKCKTI